MHVGGWRGVGSVAFGSVTGWPCKYAPGARADARGPIFLDRERFEARDAFQLDTRPGERELSSIERGGEQDRTTLGTVHQAGDPCEQPMTRGLSRFASLSPPSPGYMEYRFDHLSLSLSRRIFRFER